MTTMTLIGESLTPAPRVLMSIEGDIDPEIIYCTTCRQPRTMRVTMMRRDRIVRVQCECEQADEKAFKARLAEEERKRNVVQNRLVGMTSDLANCRFSSSEDNNAIQIAKRYMSQWESMQKDNLGLLLLGNVGTGKTHAAACIANELLDQGFRVIVTSFPRIIAEMQSFDHDGNRFLDNLANVDLLVVDDLGVERNTEYAQEIVYNLIDRRYQAGKPLIITTNLGLQDLQQPSNLQLARIYSRILEMTIPYRITGESRREDIRKEKVMRAKERLGKSQYEEQKQLRNRLSSGPVRDFSHLEE